MNGYWEIPNAWDWKELGSESVCEVIMGQSPPGESYNQSGEGMPFFQGKADFGEEFPKARYWCTDPRKISRIGDILLSVRAPVGPVNLTPYTCVIGRGLAALRPSKNIDTRYLFYGLKTLEKVVASKGTGSTFGSISKDKLSEILFPIPFHNNAQKSLIFQRQIVARIEALLSEVREMREINQRIIEDTNSLLLSTLGQLFPNPDRLLPEGWRLKTIEEISKNPQYGFTTSAKSEPIGPKFLRITDIQNGMVDWNTVPFCECNQREVDRYRLFDGDIVFARTGATTGKTFLISTPPEAVFASYLIRLQIERDASPDFVYWFFQSPYYWRQIIPRGGAQPNMNAQLLKKVKIPVPENPKIQEKIIAQAYSIQNEILQMQKDQNATGKMILDLEQAILAQAFRGEL